MSPQDTRRPPPRPLAFRSFTLRFAAVDDLLTETLQALLVSPVLIDESPDPVDPGEPAGSLRAATFQRYAQAGGT